MRDKTTDMFNRTFTVGDLVVYPIRTGSTTNMVLAQVVSLPVVKDDHYGPRVEMTVARLAKDSWSGSPWLTRNKPFVHEGKALWWDGKPKKLVRLTELKRVVIVHDDVLENMVADEYEA